MAREFGRFEPISKVAGYEAVCLAGGEQWGGFSTGINQFAILEAISRINREVFIYPFSVKKDLLAGYFRDRLEGLFARIAGARVVRDSGSGETIRVICPEVVVGADCVFSLTPSEPISRCGALAETTVVLAVTEAKNSSRQELEATICGLTAARMRVRLLTTCECEDGEYLAELSRNLGVDFIAPATWQEAVQEFKAASVVVTNRLHCMVFSFFAGVPVVPLRNREKVAGICRDAGLTSWVDCIAEFTPEKAIECIETGAATLAKMSAYRERVRKLPMEPWQVTPASD